MGVSPTRLQTEPHEATGVRGEGDRGGLTLRCQRQGAGKVWEERGSVRTPGSTGKWGFHGGLCVQT